MSKVKSEEIDCRLEAISILKAAKKQSSEVYRNDLVAQWLERGITELQEELFELLLKARGVKGLERGKGQSDPKQ